MITYLSSPRTALEASLMTGMNVVLDQSRIRSWFHSIYPTVFGRIILTAGGITDFNEFAHWSRRYKFRTRTLLAAPPDPRDHRRAFRLCRALLDSFPTYHKSYPWSQVREFSALARDRGGVMGLSLDGDRDKDYLYRVKDAVPDDLKLHGWDLSRYKDLELLNSVSVEWHPQLGESSDPLVLRVCKVIDQYKRINRIGFTQGTK